MTSDKQFIDALKYFRISSSCFTEVTSFTGGKSPRVRYCNDPYMKHIVKCNIISVLSKLASLKSGVPLSR